MTSEHGAIARPGQGNPGTLPGRKITLCGQSGRRMSA